MPCKAARLRVAAPRVAGAGAVAGCTGSLSLSVAAPAVSAVGGECLPLGLVEAAAAEAAGAVAVSLLLEAAAVAAVVAVAGVACVAAVAAVATAVAAAAVAGSLAAEALLAVLLGATDRPTMSLIKLTISLMTS